MFEVKMFTELRVYRRGREPMALELFVALWSSCFGSLTISKCRSKLTLNKNKTKATIGINQDLTCPNTGLNTGQNLI